MNTIKSSLLLCASFTKSGHGSQFKKNQSVNRKQSSMFRSLLIAVLLCTVSYSQGRLSLGNVNMPSANKVRFSVYLKNAGSSAFAYAGGSYGVDFSVSLLNGGALTAAIIASDLGSAYQPAGVTVRTDVSPYRLVFPAKSPSDGGPTLQAGDSVRIFEVEMTNTVDYPTIAGSFTFRTSSPDRTLPQKYATGNSGTLASFDPLDYIYFNHDGVLPVELESFAAVISGRSVRLQWRTASEVNVSGFTVERSSRPEGGKQREWTELSTIPAKGNSSSPNDYSYTDANLQAGTVMYRLKVTDLDGSIEYPAQSGELSVDVPVKYALVQNYPNPFNPSTSIAYSLPEENTVQLLITDINGQNIRTLTNGRQAAGYHTRIWDGKTDAGSSAVSGMYFCVMQAGKYRSVIKMLLIK